MLPMNRMLSTKLRVTDSAFLSSVITAQTDKTAHPFEKLCSGPLRLLQPLYSTH